MSRMLNRNSCRFYASQKHGFIVQDIILSKVFKLNVTGKVDNAKYDVPKEKNIFGNTENISIKTTQNNSFDTGSLCRFFDYNFLAESNTNVTLEDLLEFETFFKDMYKTPSYNPKHIWAPKLECLKNKIGILQIAPKVGNLTKINKRYPRVQGRVKNFDVVLKDFIRYKSPLNNPSLIRGVIIPGKVLSERRTLKRKELG